MTLEDAIKQAEEIAYEKDLESGFETDNVSYVMTDDERANCKKCADEHRQLAAWLKDYKRSLELSEDCVSRAEVLEMIEAIQDAGGFIGYSTYSEAFDQVDNMSPVTPSHGTCKNCEHWKDSDGVYRRGIGAESECPINIKEVCEGNFYCKNFEKRGSEDGSN